MKNFVITTSVAALCIIFSGCQSDTSQQDQLPYQGVDLPQEEAAIFDEFAVVINKQQLKLKQWEKEANIEEVLGEPQSEYTQVLPATADTHAGATLKFSTYPGITIQSYSPPGSDADSFWIMNMAVTAGDFTTGKGIKIGDSREAVIEAYPEMAVNSARAGEIFELESLDEPMFLYIVVQNNQVSEIELMYQLQ